MARYVTQKPGRKMSQKAPKTPKTLPEAPNSDRMWDNTLRRSNVNLANGGPYGANKYATPRIVQNNPYGGPRVNAFRGQLQANITATGKARGISAPVIRSVTRQAFSGDAALQGVRKPKVQKIPKGLSAKARRMV